MLSVYFLAIASITLVSIFYFAYINSFLISTLTSYSPSPFLFPLSYYHFYLLPRLVKQTLVKFSQPCTLNKTPGQGCFNYYNLSEVNVPTSLSRRFPAKNGLARVSEIATSVKRTSQHLKWSQVFTARRGEYIYNYFVPMMPPRLASPPHPGIREQ